MNLVDEKKRNCLHCALSRNPPHDLNTIKLLLEKNENLLKQKDNEGKTPYFRFLEVNSPKEVHFNEYKDHFLKYGVDLNEDFSSSELPGKNFDNNSDLCHKIWKILFETGKKLKYYHF